MRASGNDFRSKSRLRALLRQHQPQSASPSLPSEDFVLLTRASSNSFAKLYSDRLLARQATSGRPSSAGGNSNFGRGVYPTCVFKVNFIQNKRGRPSLRDQALAVCDAYG